MCIATLQMCVTLSKTPGPQLTALLYGRDFYTARNDKSSNCFIDAINYYFFNKEKLYELIVFLNYVYILH